MNETTNKLSPIHPGEILREEYMKPLGFTGDILAAALKVSRGAVHKILLGRKGITMDMAFRLARYFNTTPELWTGLQAEYDLRLARMKGQVGWRRKFKEVNWQRGAVWIGVALLILNGLFPPPLRQPTTVILWNTVVMGCFSFPTTLPNLTGAFRWPRRFFSSSFSPSLARQPERSFCLGCGIKGRLATPTKCGTNPLNRDNQAICVIGVRRR